MINYNRQTQSAVTKIEGKHCSKKTRREIGGFERDETVKEKEGETYKKKETSKKKSEMSKRKQTKENGREKGRKERQRKLGLGGKCVQLCLPFLISELEFSH